jgi:hypothetical protein
MALAIEQHATPVVSALGSLVAPLTLARERILPVPDTLTELFPEGGLVRGRTIVCDGPAATSLALALVAPAVTAGSWLAMVDLPTIGLDAALELGVPLERVVAVHAGDGPERAQRWPDVIAAAADGFDVLLARVPPDVSPSVARTVVARIRQRESVLVLLGEPDTLPIDGVLRTATAEWRGLGDGYGHLSQRRLTVQSSGRRIPGRRSCRVALPG